MEAEDRDGSVVFLWLSGRYCFTYLDLGGEVLHDCADELGFVVGEVGCGASAGSAWDVGVLHGGCWMDRWMNVRRWRRCSELIVGAREKLSNIWVVLGLSHEEEVDRRHVSKSESVCIWPCDAAAPS